MHFKFAKKEDDFIKLKTVQHIIKAKQGPSYTSSSIFDCSCRHLDFASNF